MRIGVFILLYPECFVFFLKDDGDNDIGSLVVRIILILIRVVLDVEVFPPQCLVCSNVILPDRFGKLVTNHIDKSSVPVDGWNFIAVIVFYGNRWYTMLPGKTEVVGTERRRCVYNARAVFCGNEVARNDNKGFVGVVQRLRIRDELLVADPQQRRS